MRNAKRRRRKRRKRKGIRGDEE
ncbi:hypothetical protein E2C01_095048 [Portunus trituberculatus]|uniref:Uncharacterized protein n=1 Tax=Portunus trituberculatus TaxID=210409 RepID=A0A5B7JNU2_PORTR|nr:hypothetical protein [Portunus trituberculatus]